MTITDLLITPFADYPFMKRALAACLILSISGTPLGIFMTLRNMSLVGDAMSHAILPGIAIAFLLFGISVWPMTVAAMLAGIVIAGVALFLTRATQLREDSVFTLIYLVSLAFGVVMVNQSGSGVDLLHILFGNILAVDDASLFIAAGVACASVLVLSQIYRALVIDAFDPDFLRAATNGRVYVDGIFFLLVIINLVASFQILGTLMSLGLILLPAIAARFWTRHIDRAIPIGVAIAAVSSAAGLLASYHLSLPSGPAVVLVAGAICAISAIAGRHGSVRTYLRN